MTHAPQSIERTLLILKPDAVKRALIGTIFELFERVGLKLQVAKMVRPEADVIKHHYPGADKNWIREMGEKTLASFDKSGIDVVSKLGTKDPMELGKYVYERLIKYWQEGPIVVSVWQGPGAIAIARKLRGHTIPLLADPGSLHGQYSYDSSLLSSGLDRVVKTFVHASGSADEAEREIQYWFPSFVATDYKREVDDLYL